MPIRSYALGALVLAFVLPALCPTAGAAAADPSALVTELGAQMRQVLGDKSLTPVERQQRFGVLLDDGFDFPTISRFVLGHYWQTSSEGFRHEFSGVFEAYVLQSLSGRFDDYSGESMVVTATHVESERSTIVSTAIVHPNGTPPAKVDWRVLSTANGFKIADVSVSGISMALSYRDQFVAVIDRDGGQPAALISDLREKLEKPTNDSRPSNSATQETAP
jgi:phospholipid transport system substrate-binding protein